MVWKGGKRVGRERQRSGSPPGLLSVLRFQDKRVIRILPELASGCGGVRGVTQIATKSGRWAQRMCLRGAHVGVDVTHSNGQSHSPEEAQVTSGPALESPTPRKRSKEGWEARQAQQSSCSDLSGQNWPNKARRNLGTPQRDSLIM